MFYPRLFSILGFFGVSLGAFGAHGLKNKVTVEMLDVWKTATLYLMLHVIVGIFSCFITDKKRSQFCFAFGALVFSCSLYLLVILNMPILGSITPLGGVSLLLGWIFLFFDIKKKSKI